MLSARSIMVAVAAIVAVSIGLWVGFSLTPVEETPLPAGAIEFSAARNGRAEFWAFAPHDANCSRDGSDVAVSSPPKNGEVVISNQTIKLTASGYPRCVGRDIEAAVLNYIPHRDFTGTDYIEISVAEITNGVTAVYKHNFVARVK